MKILFVTPFLPSPPRFGGQRRLDGLMRGLARKHEVDVVSFSRTDEYEQSSAEATKEYCSEVVTIPNLDLVATSDKRKAQLKSMLSWHSFEHSLAAGRGDFQAALDDRLRRKDYDVIQVEFVWMTAFRFGAPGGARPLLVLDEHNVEYDILKRTAGGGGGVSRLLYNSLNWRKLALEERAAWRKFDGISLTSRRDEELVQRDAPGVRTAVVPNGVDVGEFGASTSAVEPDTLLFFGAINYYPNQEALIYFIDNVFPLIKQRRPQTKFKVLGPGAPEAVLARAGNGVEVLGMVPDVGPYLESATAIVVPLRIGGGTRLKIVEALSKGKAVVSTHLGAEGIDVEHDQHLLLADEPEAFAREVERVLSDPDLAARLGRAGRQLMEERYSWQSIVAGLEQFFETLAVSPRAVRAARA